MLSHVFIAGKNGGSRDVNSIEKLVKLMEGYTSIILYGVSTESGSIIFMRDERLMGATSYHGYVSLREEYQGGVPEVDALNNLINARLKDLQGIQQA